MKILTSILKRANYCTLNSVSHSRSSELQVAAFWVCLCNTSSSTQCLYNFLGVNKNIHWYMPGLHKIKIYYPCCFLSSSSAAYLIKDGNEIGLTLQFLVELCVSYCSSISEAAFWAIWLQRCCPCCLCVYPPVASQAFTSSEMQLLTLFSLKSCLPPVYQ